MKPFMVIGSFPDQQNPTGTYYCKNGDEVHDAIFLINTNGGTVTFIGQRVDLPFKGPGIAYEYREMEGV